MNVCKQIFYISHVRISERCFNAKSSTYHFHMKTKTLADFQICISVPLTILILYSHEYYKLTSAVQSSQEKAKRCSEDMQQLHSTLFNKISSFVEITLRHGSSPVNLLHIFRTPFFKNTFEKLFLNRVYVILYVFIVICKISFQFCAKISIPIFFFSRNFVVFLKSLYIAVGT